MEKAHEGQAHTIEGPLFARTQAGKMTDKLEGADSAALAQKLQRLIGDSGGQLSVAPKSVQPPPEVAQPFICLGVNLWRKHEFK